MPFYILENQYNVHTLQYSSIFSFNWSFSSLDHIPCFHLTPNKVDISEDVVYQRYWYYKLQYMNVNMLNAIHVLSSSHLTSPFTAYQYQVSHESTVQLLTFEWSHRHMLRTLRLEIYYCIFQEHADSNIQSSTDELFYWYNQSNERLLLPASNNY